MRRFPFLLLVLLPAATAAQAAPQTERQPLRVTDIYRLRDVRDPQVSPDGAWIAYTLSGIDSAKDKSDTDVWMVSWDGAHNLRLTSTPENESSPRWSPDGRYLAFVSGRQEGKGGQIWLMDRRGGEAQRVTRIRDGVSDYAWSPDSKRLLLGIDEETDSLLKKDTSEKKTPRPIVIDRYQFKRDRAGYLQTSRTRLSIFDVDSRKLEPLTSGMANDGNGAWSPDGKWVAFIRTPLREPGNKENSDVWVVEARAGAEPRRLTDFAGPDDGRPAWSPDGQWIAFQRGDEPKYSAYDMNRLAIVRADGSAPARVLTQAFDRGLSSPTFAPDGRWIYALTSDDRAQHLVRVRVSDGSVERVIAGKRVVSSFDIGGTGGGRIATLAATPDRSAEVFAWDNGALRALTHHNDSLFARLQLGTTEDFTSRSADGTEVHGLLVRPAGTQSALPTILYIHGGPNSQDSYQFSFDREFFAANGYAVLAINYRGSGGRGDAYSKAIFADWGNKEVVDLLGAVDEAVRRGIADPNRLGIGGWSYGGILTDYTIATTTRFAAAVSGAGSAMQLSMYGHDQYIPQYDLEIGYPWKNQERWIKISYPFFHADRIKTPTLFMGGQNDFNVPIIGGEQMYQALRTLGVPTQLVIYPNQYHGITIPSYRVDRLQRYLAWYDRYLKQGVIQASGTQPSR